ncbi:PH domain-containing protein [Nocardioides aequoreus]|uniref:PH domain-containing protein n=1 Tax=Nocardioides aequoreus TaxID=397278 RepID=UPI00068D553D|nr:PH domain-containing protein [Nocardioides aequoreus]
MSDAPQPPSQEPQPESQSVPQSEPPVAPPPVVPWRRLDRRMLLVHPVNEAAKFLPVLVGIVVVGRDSGGWQLLGLAIPVVWGLWRYVTTSFRITETHVELRRGLLSQKVLTARLDRVRSVELSSSLMHRLLGLAKVRIGTGSAATITDDSGFELDALGQQEARTLRTQLLRLGEPAPAVSEQGEPVAPPGDEVLLELDPRWARYAPFTSSGNVIAAGVLAALGQLADALGPEVVDLGFLGRLGSAAVVPLVLAVVALLVVLGAVFGVLGYLVSNWGFLLTRRPDGSSLHVRRGLVTTTETSLESRRVRGVTLAEPLGLRLLGAARLKAMVVGASLSEGGTTTIAPNCPRPVAVAAAERVLGSASALAAPLTEHGPVARRRRLFRALVPTVLLLAGLAVAVVLLEVLAWWVLLPGLALLPLAWWLAVDRYRRLGHALVDGHLVVRSGTLAGRHVALDLDGVIGWHVTQTFFQRRQGVATLVATTAAGSQSYDVPDLPLATAAALALRADRRLVGQFTEPGSLLTPSASAPAAARAASPR